MRVILPDVVARGKGCNRQSGVVVYTSELNHFVASRGFDKSRAFNKAFSMTDRKPENLKPTRLSCSDDLRSWIGTIDCVLLSPTTKVVSPKTRCCKRSTCLLLLETETDSYLRQETFNSADDPANYCTDRTGLVARGVDRLDAKELKVPSRPSNLGFAEWCDY